VEENMNVEDRRREVVLSKDEIATRVRELGAELSKDYEGKNLLAISLLKGSFIFTADLVREMSIPVHIEFMITSSYGHGEESTGELRIEKDIDVDDLSEFDVLIVDDIVDSGITMFETMKLLKSRNPKTIKSCTLLDKPSRRIADIKPDYCGFSISDQFIVGYGLNYKDHYRNVDHIFAFMED
jgi:hypoxanthine phosphoribosyltransferase